MLFISQVTVLAQTTSKSLCVVYFTGHSPGTDNIKEFVCCLFHRSQSWHRQYQRVCVLFISQVTVLAQTISKSLCVVYFTGHSPGTDNIKEFVCCLFHRSQSWHRQYQRVCVVYFTGHSPSTDNIKEFASLTQESSVSGLCEWTDPPVCLAIPVKDLQWRLHGRHWYYVSLKLEGINGLDRVASSDVYEHYRGPPYGGMVVELPLSTTELVSKNVFMEQL